MVAHIYRGVRGDGSRVTEAAAIDVAALGAVLGHAAVDEVHLGIGAGGAGGIGSVLATAVDIVDHEGGAAAALVEHIDSNLAGDGTAGVVATEGGVDGATQKVEGDVAIDGAVNVVATEDIGVFASHDGEGDVGRTLCRTDISLP